MTRRYTKKGREGRPSSLRSQEVASEQKIGGTRQTGYYSPPEKLVRFFPWLLLVMLGIVFGQSLFFQFVDWDDNLNVYENPYLLSLSAQGLWRLWCGPYASLYVPLVYTTYFLELWLADFILYLLGLGSTASTEQVTASFFRLSSGIMHLNNILLHWGCSLCAFYILRRIFRDRNWGVMLGALVFALHPIQVEPIVWVTGRKDLLMWTLVLTALVMFLRGLGGKQRGLLFLTGATVLFIGSLLSKPTAVILPGLAVLLVWYFRVQDRRVWATVAMWFIMALIAYWVHRAPQSDLRDAPFLVPLWKRPFLAADNLWFYIQKLIVPWPLLPIYPRKVSDVLGNPTVWIKLPVAVGVAILVGRSRVGALAVGFILLPVLPVLGFVPFIYQYFSVVADRYFYGSMVGLGILTCMAVGKILSSHLMTAAVPRRLFAVGLSLAVGAMATASGLQARHWKDSVSLWQHELRHFPGCVHALYNLASRHAEQGRIKEAIDLYERILIVDPYYAAAYTNLIILNEQLGRSSDVKLYAAAALELQPNCAENFLARGHGYLALGRAAEAVESFKAAIHGLPEDAPAHNSLGMAYRACGDLANAEKAFRRAIALNPALIPAHLNLAELLAKQGDLRGAIAEYEEVLKIDPSQPQAKRRLQELSKSGK